MIKRILIQLTLTYSLAMNTALSAQTPAWDIDKVVGLMKLVVAEWENERRINLDPRSTNHIANEAMHFIEVFGFEYSASGRTAIPNVISLIDDHERVRQIVFAYLDDSKTATELQNIMDRMAKLFDKSSELAGWPSNGPNPYKFVDLDDQLPDGEIELTSDGIADTKVPFRHFLLLPGDHTVSTDTESWELPPIKSVPGAQLAPTTKRGR